MGYTNLIEIKLQGIGWGVGEINFVLQSNLQGTAVELKYGIITHSFLLQKLVAPECLTHELTVEAKSGVTLTRDSIVD